jgi:hypothetical protein
MAEEKRKLVRAVIKGARLINQSFFEKDIYDQGGPNEGKPSYKFEVAVDEKSAFGEGSFEDDVIEAVVAEWGGSAEDDLLDGKIAWFKDGDEIAADRKERGKPHDAYEGKIIFRGHTQFNRYGDDGPGGIEVYDENVKPVDPVNAGVIFRGCYGEVAVDINPYIEPRSKQKCVSYYLVAFQKTGGDPEKDRLAGGGDNSSLFKPTGRAEGGRRSRKG